MQRERSHDGHPAVDYQALRRKTAPLLLCERARAEPAAVAFRSKHLGLYRERSWHDYAAMVARAARALRSARPQPGERVAIMGDACEEWMICDLAAQSLGAIVYGIYPTASASEVEYQMRDGGAAVFIAEDQEYVDKILPIVDELPALALDRRDRRPPCSPTSIRSSGATTNCWRKPVSPISRMAGDSRSRSSIPPQPAFIVYTSGTTGHPKGALVTHGKHLAATANIVEPLSDARRTSRTAPSSTCRSATCSAATSPSRCR